LAVALSLRGSVLPFFFASCSFLASFLLTAFLLRASLAVATDFLATGFLAEDFFDWARRVEEKRYETLFGTH
jgi:hypothetical protein